MALYVTVSVFAPAPAEVALHTSKRNALTVLSKSSVYVLPTESVMPVIASVVTNESEHRNSVVPERTLWLVATVNAPDATPLEFH